MICRAESLVKIHFPALLLESQGQGHNTKFVYKDTELTMYSFAIPIFPKFLPVLPRLQAGGRQVGALIQGILRKTCCCSRYQNSMSFKSQKTGYFRIQVIKIVNITGSIAIFFIFCYH